MTKLGALERDLVISYLAEERITFTVYCADGGSRANNTVRLEVDKENTRVSKTGIITVKNPPDALKEWVSAGKKISFVFYFKKLGLTFMCAADKTQAVPTFTIPGDISRLEEREAKEKTVTANLYFSLSEKKDANFSCDSREDFPLFKPEVRRIIARLPDSERAAMRTAQSLKQWYNIPIAQISRRLFDCVEKSGRLLYKGPEGIPEKQPFDFDLCMTKSDFDSSDSSLAGEIAALPHRLYMPLGGGQGGHCLCAALSPNGGGQSDSEAIENLLVAAAASAFCAIDDEYLEPIEGRNLPLSIVFLTDKFIVLGGKSKSFPLAKGQEYAVQISCAETPFKRIIHATLAVGDIISLSDGGGDANCASVCAFTSVQTEDRRFLFEKLYGTILK